MSRGLGDVYKRQKWCGKTWTSSYHCKSAVYIGDPAGNFQNRKLAEVSPALVLEGEPPRLIDEWQEVPSLWDAVRHKVDATPEKGRFILTGSATPNHKGILHSGAGRIARLRMRPMSLYESGDSSGEVSLKKLCDGELTPVATGEVDLQKLIDLIVRGGWPGSLGLAPAYAIAGDAFRAYKTHGKIGNPKACVSLEPNRRQAQAWIHVASASVFTIVFPTA